MNLDNLQLISATVRPRLVLCGKCVRTGETTDFLTLTGEGVGDLVVETLDAEQGEFLIRSQTFFELLASAALEAAEKFTIGMYIFWALFALNLFARA